MTEETGKIDATELGMEDSSPPVTLSEETLKKFDEVNASIEAEENGEEPAEPAAEPIPEPATPKKSLNPREGDEGLDKETGEVLIEPKAEEVKKEEEPVEEEPAEEGKAEETTPEPEKATLTHRQIQAAQRNHLSDEDILTMGDKAGEVLDRMADTLDESSRKHAEDGRRLRELGVTQPKQTPKAEAKLPAEGESYGEQVVDETEFTKRLKTLDERVVAIEKEEANRRQQFIDSTVNSFFDSMTKEYPEFGNSKSLTTDQFRKRDDIYRKAYDIAIGAASNGQQMPNLHESLGQAFSIYEGDNIKEKVRDKLVADAKARQKQFTARPTQRKTAKQFKTIDEQAQEKVRTWWEKRGEKVSEDDEF